MTIEYSRFEKTFKAHTTGISFCGFAMIQT